MKTKLIISLGVLLFPLLTFAQVAEQRPTTFYVVKSNFSKKEIITKNLIIEASNIANMKILSKEEAEDQYGRLGKNILVTIITPNSGVKLSTVGEFFKHHNIQGNQRDLPFVIDGEAVRDTTNLLIEENSFKLFHVRADSIEIMTAGHLHTLDLKKRGLYHN